MLGEASGPVEKWALPGELSTARKSDAGNSAGGRLSGGRGGASNDFKSHRTIRLLKSSETY